MREVFEQIELPAKLQDGFSWSNKSSINQSTALLDLAIVLGELIWNNIFGCCAGPL